MISRRLAVMVLALAPALSCYSPARMRPQTPRCPGPDTGPRQRWQHRFGSAATSTLVGDPHHSATDPVINPGNDAMVRAKFAYGTVSKDLEGEDASLWLQMRPCGRWAEVDQQRTNHAGRATFAVPAALIARVGAYPFQLVVRGDLTRAHGTIFVVAEGTQAVAFDVDGTLTTGDSELIEQIALGNDPEVRPGASATVRLYAEAGYLPIYITGRPYMLRKSSRDWLRRHGFPPGVMITTDRLRDSRPSRDAIGRFKRSALLALIEGSHLDIVSAYGNAGTDICAYAEAGIDPRSTYIVGKHRGQHCGGYVATQPIYDYREHARTLAAMPRAK